MKISIFTVILCTLSIFQTHGQTILELNKGNAVLRSKNYHDYDRKNIISVRTPSSADSLAYLQNLKMGLNDMAHDSLELAEKHFKHCLQLCPLATTNTRLKQYIGDIALTLGRPSDAARCYSEILQDVPLDLDTRFKRAKAYIELGNAEAALSDCIALLPYARTDSLKGHIHFIKGAAEMLRKHYSPAIYEFEQTLHYTPKNANAELLIVSATAMDGRKQEALRLVEAYLKKYPKDSTAQQLKWNLLLETLPKKRK